MRPMGGSNRSERAGGSHAPRRPVVAVMFGGRSGEHEVSIQSGHSIFGAIDRERWRPIPIGITRDGAWHLGADASIFDRVDDVRTARIATDADRSTEVIPAPSSADGSVPILARDTGREVERVDVFFPILHGTLGEDGSVQGLLRMLGAPFVGPDLGASADAMDKTVAKRLLADAGIPVARSVTVARAEPRPDFERILADLGPRVFVKPANLGSSVGIRPADDPVACADAIEHALRFDRRALIEEAIDGREIEFAALGNEEIEISIPGEIVPRDGFYSYEAKYVDSESATLRAPAEMGPEALEEGRRIAERAYRALGCEGMSRIDLFLKADGSWVVNEINTLPGFTAISMFPRLFDLSGLPYPRLLDRLLELALERHRRDLALARVRDDALNAGPSRPTA